ncbi:MAG TPA: hypothetical protein V6C81_14920 [Planktothrix sp.]|jgi:hypothetical protein
MQVNIHDFIIADTSVVCPNCQMPFATPQVMKMPEITKDTVVEADLHRVLPHSSIRAALIAICPACVYTWWSTAFGPHYYVPDLLVPSPEIEYPKKFAHAVLSGRKSGAHALDRALLALNGCWCARETYIGAGPDQVESYQADNTRWLTLAAQELEEALSDDSWKGNRDRYTYLYAEVLRQLGRFEDAVKTFKAVKVRYSILPSQLVEHQQMLAQSGNPHPTELPPHLVEAIFMPKPIVLPDAEPEPEEEPMMALSTNSMASAAIF